LRTPFGRMRRQRNRLLAGLQLLQANTAAGQIKAQQLQPRQRGNEAFPAAEEAEAQTAAVATHVTFPGGGIGRRCDGAAHDVITQIEPGGGRGVIGGDALVALPAEVLDWSGRRDALLQGALLRSRRRRRGWRRGRRRWRDRR